MSLLSGLSMVLGLARDVAVAAVFGAGAALDAFLVSQGLMNLVLGLLAGAMSKATIPVLAREVDAGRPERAHRSVRVVLTVTVVVLGLASVPMWLGAEAVVAVLAPGFGKEQRALAGSLTRVVLLATVLIAATNLLAAVAQGHRRFFWAGVQGVPFNLVMLAAAVLAGPRYGVLALAAGFVAGSAARLALQLVPLRAIGMRLVPSLRLRDPGFREIAVLVPPLLLASAIGNVNTLVDRAVGSAQGEGVITALSYGWRLVMLADALLVVSLVTALYPAFGAAAAQGPQRVTALLTRALGTVTVLLVPIVALLVVAARPAVALVFGRGDFDAADVALTGTAVAWYAAGPLFLGWREVAFRASYALGDSRRPLRVAVVAMAVNVVGDLSLGPLYGVAGLAAATTASLAVAALLAARDLIRRHQVLALRPLAGVAARSAAAGGLAAAAAWVAARWLTALLGPGSTLRSGPQALLLLAVTGTVVVGVFSLVLVALRAPEIADARRVPARLARLAWRRRRGR